MRPIHEMVDKALGGLNKDFEKMYPRMGRPSIPPERLLRTLLIQMLYSIRSERMLIEQLEYSPLFRWSVGVWHVTTFTQNRERLLEEEILGKFFN